MKNITEGSAGGASIFTVVFAVFLVLKLTDLLPWTWLWVTSPLWIGAALDLLKFLVLFVARYRRNF